MISFHCMNVLFLTVFYATVCCVLLTLEANSNVIDISNVVESTTDSYSTETTVGIKNSQEEIELTLDGKPQVHKIENEKEVYKGYNNLHEDEKYENYEDYFDEDIYDNNDEDFFEGDDDDDDDDDDIQNDDYDVENNEKDNSQQQGRAESERIEAFMQRGYVWPIPDGNFKPNTTGVINSTRKRFEQVDKLDDINDRWVAFTSLTTRNLIIPNFTEHGFGLTKCIDEELMNELRQTVRDGYESAELEGHENGSITGPLPPLKVENVALTTRVYTELQRYAEAWAGIKLVPFGAYGFRVYRNGAQLKMHTDIPQTHIISFILHIDHSDDGTPWPLVIEDYHGNTHEVSLESGDLLFYESAKLLHGRPRPFNGTWYSSVFVHYYPADGWKKDVVDIESENAVPPGWETQLFETYAFEAPKVQMYGVTMAEPECEYMWCGLQNSTKWGGPAKAGYWIAPNREQYPFEISPYEYFYDDNLGNEHSGGSHQQGRDELERIEAFKERGYVWPIPDSNFKPFTTGFINSMRKRFEQVDKLNDITDRWVAFRNLMQWSMVVPNFTEHGFGLTKCIAEELMNELRQTVRDGYESAALEGFEDGSITGPLPPVKVENEALTSRVCEELQKYAEVWAGIKLIPVEAYGFRVYRNGAQLKMHTDMPETHIISLILHIDHSDDGAPWPLVIEDYQGKTHEVSLESGDLLFYESAKLLHGRPRPFNGTWYSSVFVHFYPADGWIKDEVDVETENSVPPGWETQLFETYVYDAPQIQIHGVTAMTEPECEYMWCGLQNSTKWGGPAKAGYWIAPTMEQYPFEISLDMPSNVNDAAAST